jgi:uncharacterized protein YqeY
MRDRMRADLTRAMKSRDLNRVRALRSALAAIENAEAVDGPGHSEMIIGYGDVARRALGKDDLLDLIGAEIQEREASVDEYLRLGLSDRAGTLQREIDILREYLDHV